jgi:hypothetical protein
LSNVLDQRSLQHLVTSGTPLFQDDLAASIKAHFSDLLDTLNGPDEENEDEEEEDDEADGQPSGIFVYPPGRRRARPWIRKRGQG